VQELIHANRPFIVREISAEVGISYGMCQAILTEDLNMQHISVKFVHVLTTEQKQHSLCVSTNLLQEAEKDQKVMQGTIIGDRTWVYEYDLEMKHQSSQWKSPKSPRPKRMCQVHFKVKVMLIFF
jgi:hypothetical protein